MSQADATTPQMLRCRLNTSQAGENQRSLVVTQGGAGTLRLERSNDTVLLGIQADTKLAGQVTLDKAP
ncbi:hypothetical protein [Pseudosulfitobacter koreensis]|uniref:Uncharacterized protein n=1 Tax=Pseudosulfitobacter koreensis TaxID=2968472 RepID=A0ABT1YZ72_9RHOB|nr:hypothetical protein [Pseudosulfitobacter koreense]MCR8826182.1 hypothetical protein [Pseudosulfitobacter koreense]